MIFLFAKVWKCQNCSLTQTSFTVLCASHHLIIFCSQTILIKAGSSDSQLSLCRRTSTDVNLSLVPSLTNQGSPLGERRKQRRLQHYNSLPVFFLPLIHPSHNSSPSRPVSILLTFSLPFFLFHFLTAFPLTTLEHLPSPSPVPRLILSVSRSCRL